MKKTIGDFYKLDCQRMPKHIALIMDGNRRWAKEKGKTASQGHQAGAENLKELVEHAEKIGIKHLTVYALSTENWRKRAKQEVKGLFDLMIRVLKEKKDEYQKKGIKFFVLGNFQAFPLRVRRLIAEALKIVKEKERMKFNVALNYGGRDELIRAIKQIIKDGVKPGQVNEKLVSKYLYTEGQPDPDLMIRTGGEVRISNFLLWQLSYAELYFTDTLWPDFGPKKFEKAIFDYQQRERRFGGGK
ncbi:MAG: polyprenyl diphosphate synthase [Patescibacteria group bacterium]